MEGRELNYIYMTQLNLLLETFFFFFKTLKTYTVYNKFIYGWMAAQTRRILKHNQIKVTLPYLLLCFYYSIPLVTQKNR